MIAPYLHKYFWDIAPRQAHPHAHPDYYIQRILEFGDRQAVHWLKRVFGKTTLRQVGQRVKLSPRSRCFWNLALKNV